jgi:hypothetical protein
MPPKKPEKKVEEDFSDVATLPTLNSFNFALLLDFQVNEHKDQVLKQFTAHPNDKTKVLTRDDIITHGKGKAIITDPPAPTEENPNPYHNEDE